MGSAARCVWQWMAQASQAAELVASPPEIAEWKNPGLRCHIANLEVYITFQPTWHWTYAYPSAFKQTRRVQQKQQAIGHRRIPPAPGDDAQWSSLSWRPLRGERTPGRKRKTGQGGEPHHSSLFGSQMWSQRCCGAASGGEGSDWRIYRWVSSLASSSLFGSPKGSQRCCAAASAGEGSDGGKRWHETPPLSQTNSSLLGNSLWSQRCCAAASEREGRYIRCRFQRTNASFFGRHAG